METAIYPKIGDNWVYTLLGLGGEVGEIQNKCKKIIRDHNGIMTDEKRDELVKELGDVLWYVAMFAHELDADLDIVAKYNVTKLATRKAKNTISGSGDNR